MKESIWNGIWIFFLFVVLALNIFVFSDKNMHPATYAVIFLTIMDMALKQLYKIVETNKEILKELRKRN